MAMASSAKKLRDLQQGLRDRLRELREDKTISAEERARLVREEQERYREAYRREKTDLLEDLEARRIVAYKKAHPAEKPGADTQAEILREQRRERIHRELTAQWAGRNGGPTLEEYEAAIASGDELRIEALEVYGPGAITNDDMRAQYTRKVAESRSARMPEEQVRAFEELEELDREKFETNIALGFMDKTSRELTSTSAAS